jgi:glycerophosphoryl diester phosphodiesterase
MKLLLTIFLFMMFAFSAHSQTQIIAHRGFSSQAPENTLAAFQKAIDLGVPYLELDVHQTADHVIVVIHDESVDRTSSNTQKGKVSDMTYQELQDVRVGYTERFDTAFADEKIPTLKEVLLLAKGKIKVCIEIKVYGIEQEVVDIIRETEMMQDVVVFSFYYPVLAKIKSLQPDVKTLFLISKANEDTADYAQIIGCMAIGVGKETEITPEFVNNVHKSGLQLWLWTIDDPETMQKLVDLKVDGIITNKPDLLVD